jgi:hypothetical protein
MRVRAASKRGHDARGRDKAYTPITVNSNNVAMGIDRDGDGSVKSGVCAQTIGSACSTAAR